MDATEREQLIQEAVDRAVEKALLVLPSVMGNLMTQQAAYNKLNSEFYKDHPEFVQHKDVVMSVIEKVDGQNPTLSYEEKLKKAVPEIRSRLAEMEKLDMNSVNTKPNRAFVGEQSLSAFASTKHGEI